MLKSKIESICKNKILGVSKFSWFKDDVGYIEFENLKIAFDIIIGTSNIGIDIVLRPKANKTLFSSLYPQLKNNIKHRLLTFDKNTSSEVIVSFINSEYKRIIDNLNIVDKEMISQEHKLFYVNQSNELSSAPVLKMFFWAGVPNFGDLIGPWLASKLTGRSILNVRDLDNSSDALFGVGSIIGLIEEKHQRTRIWGSGLVTNKNLDKVMLQLKKSNIKRISAVRGKYTEEILTKHGYNVPKIYGDPALIFSNLYNPKNIKLKHKKVIVPHYIHYDLFTGLNLDGYEIIDVKSEVTAVVNHIANADLVISTSMHGIILAQSYGVPWVHLHLYDGLLLAGDEFKFHDFFSTLDLQSVSQVKVPLAHLNKNTLDRISIKASLPKYDKCYNSSAIIDSFFEAIK